MKKNEITDFSTAFDYCFERANLNVIKTLGKEIESGYCEATYLKRFCKAHPNLGTENWEVIKDNTPIFTRRMEYMIASDEM